jgi:hypothetical protein
MQLAPVVLFTYNRPWHTEKVVKALEKNKLSENTDLIIYSDGPKNDSDRRSVKLVRSYLEKINCFKSVKIIIRDKNKGLAYSIINGVSAVINKHGKAIVLEDDIVTSPFFLKYMNDALTYYQSKPQVMHISGYIPPINPDGLPQTFFLRPTSCWGWGTWKRAWGTFEKDAEKILKKFTLESKKKFNLNNSYNYFSHITANQQGKISTWAIFWYASVFFADGLSLHPVQSLVENIGHDSSGVHCVKNTKFSSPLLKHPIVSFTDIIQEHPLATEQLMVFYNSLQKPFYKRILHHSMRLICRK